MPLTPKEIVKILEENGFYCARQNGSHRFYKNDSTGKVTTVPMHAKELKKGTEQKILKDAGLK
ncbi:MAG: type II toxin-antitoxin system HicA family toxin [Clostridia bacterium]|nr:type II toxin-antitoxin system HicA family toxin [Clostridia bacterium]